MSELFLQEELEQAEAAVAYARAIRTRHAKRTSPNSKQRNADLEFAAERLKIAMQPLRAAIGRFPYGHGTFDEQSLVTDASLAIQRERRKIWKMKNRARNNG